MRQGVCVRSCWGLELRGLANASSQAASACLAVDRRTAADVPKLLVASHRQNVVPNWGPSCRERGLPVLPTPWARTGCGRHQALETRIGLRKILRRLAPRAPPRAGACDCAAACVLLALCAGGSCERVAERQTSLV
eukprot:scaffold2437_cov395-Prasinococcus_capsulatus_cf.AAC.4